jgi:hypothetical protein
MQAEMSMYDLIPENSNKPQEFSANIKALWEKTKGSEYGVRLRELFTRARSVFFQDNSQQNSNEGQQPEFQPPQVQEPQSSGVETQQLPTSFPRVLTRVLESNQSPNDWAAMARNPYKEVITNDQYVENYGKAENYIQYHLDRFIDDEEGWYTTFIPSIHRVIITGNVEPVGDAGNNYQGVSEDAKDRIRPGEYRTQNDIFSDNFLAATTFVENLADITEDPYSKNGGSSQLYKYAPNGEQPDVSKDGMVLYGAFFYPNSERIKPALENMRQEYKLALQANDPEEVLDHLAKGYWNVRYHFFDGVNNSWMMAMANNILTRKGMGKLSHFDLDFASHPLQPDNFAKVFKWHYYNFAEKAGDVRGANEARLRKEFFLQWMDQQHQNFDKNGAKELDFSTFPPQLLSLDTMKP